MTDATPIAIQQPVELNGVNPATFIASMYLTRMREAGADDETAFTNLAKKLRTVQSLEDATVTLVNAEDLMRKDDDKPSLSGCAALLELIPDVRINGETATENTTAE